MLTMTVQDQAAREWATMVARDAITGQATDCYYATNAHLERAIGTGTSEEEARMDLLDLAFQWASGVLGAGDVLPNLNPR